MRRPREVLGSAFLLLAGREHFSLDDLISVAERLELDPEEARSALEERRFRERVEDVEGARRAGVHGTPTFFVNGERLEGPWRRLQRSSPQLWREAESDQPRGADRGGDARDPGP